MKQHIKIIELTIILLFLLRKTSIYIHKDVEEFIDAFEDDELLALIDLKDFENKRVLLNFGLAFGLVFVK